MEEVAVRAGYEVLMEVHGNILLTVGDSQGTLDQQLRHYSVHLSNIIIVRWVNCIKLYFTRFLDFLKTEEGEMDLLFTAVINFIL